MLTGPCIVGPLIPHFYNSKIGFTGVNRFFFSLNFAHEHRLLVEEPTSKNHLNICFEKN